jgi:hypothetical protein
MVIVESCLKRCFSLSFSSVCKSIHLYHEGFITTNCNIKCILAKPFTFLAFFYINAISTNFGNVPENFLKDLIN